MSKVYLSKPVKIDLAVYKGDSGTFRITVIPETGADPVDISEADFDADIRETAESTSTIGSFTVTPVDGDLASVDVTLPAALSATLPDFCVYDVEMRMDDEVATLCQGNVLVKQDVSRP